MTVTYGFYNSKNHDRKYNAKQMSNLFEGILNDGVFASIGTSLVVTAGNGMTVNVGVGRAWFNRTWTDNDSVLPLVVAPSGVATNRIDAVVIEVDTSDNVRANSIKIVQGIASVTPENPVMANTETLHQYPLCYIYVGVGVTEVLQTNITNLVGTEVCPFITGILQTMTVEGISALLEAEFDAWFDGVKGQLNGDVAGSLLNTINQLIILDNNPPAVTQTQQVWLDIV